MRVASKSIATATVPASNAFCASSCCTARGFSPGVHSCTDFTNPPCPTTSSRREAWSTDATKRNSTRKVRNSPLCFSLRFMSNS